MKRPPLVAWAAICVKLVEQAERLNDEEASALFEIRLHDRGFEGESLARMKEIVWQRRRLSLRSHLTTPHPR